MAAPDREGAASGAPTATANGYARYNRAYQLFAEQGLSLEQVNAETCIPLSTLKNWSSKDGWVEDKTTMQSSLQEVTRALLAAQVKLSEKARNGDQQAVFALLKMRREMRHQTDTNSVITEFCAALMAVLENNGEHDAASVVAVHMRSAAERVAG